MHENISPSLWSFALNQQHNVNATTKLSVFEWFYITSQLTIPVEYYNSNSSTIITRDQAARERLKCMHKKEIIKINSNKRIELFQNVFGKHSLIGYRVRPPSSSKLKMHKANNQLLCSSKFIQEEEWINCIANLDDDSENRGMDLIYDPIHNTLRIELRYKKMRAIECGFLQSQQFINQTRTEAQVIEVGMQYHDGMNGFVILNIQGNKISSQIVEIAGNLPDTDMFITHDIKDVINFLNNI